MGLGDFFAIIELVSIATFDARNYGCCAAERNPTLVAVAALPINFRMRFTGTVNAHHMQFVATLWAFF
jgi:hypothetical protein